jgi:hypothetical protein
MMMMMMNSTGRHGNTEQLFMFVNDVSIITDVLHRVKTVIDTGHMPLIERSRIT